MAFYNLEYYSSVCSSKCHEFDVSASLQSVTINCEKSTFPQKITHLSMELGLVIGTIRKGIKSTI